jgi:type II secretory pathway pseudopilin PulG
MKRAAAISAAILFFLLLGNAASARAQEHEQQGKEQNKSQQGQQHQQQPGHQQGQPAQQQHQQPAQQQHQQQAHKPAQTQGKPQQTYGGAYHGGVQPNGPTHGGVHHSGVPQHQGQVRAGFTQSRAHSWNDDHRTWTQRGGYNGYRVPEDRFRMYFGSDHYFRINSLPMLFVGGYPRFQYDGYWATFVDPWPESWPADWYETDDVYLDYANDGYYLYDRNRPGPGIAITLAF